MEDGDKGKASFFELRLGPVRNNRLETRSGGELLAAERHKGQVAMWCGLALGRLSSLDADCTPINHL